MNRNSKHDKFEEQKSLQLWTIYTKDCSIINWQYNNNILYIIILLVFVYFFIFNVYVSHIITLQLVMSFTSMFSLETSLQIWGVK